MLFLQQGLLWLGWAARYTLFLKSDSGSWHVCKVRQSSPSGMFKVTPTKQVVIKMCVLTEMFYFFADIFDRENL